MEADVVYVRDFRDMTRMSVDQLGHLAMISHHIYGSFDLAVRCLVQLVERGIIQTAGVHKYTNSIRPGA